MESKKSKRESDAKDIKAFIKKARQKLIEYKKGNADGRQENTKQ